MKITQPGCCLMQLYIYSTNAVDSSSNSCSKEIRNKTQKSYTAKRDQDYSAGSLPQSPPEVPPIEIRRILTSTPTGLLQSPWTKVLFSCSVWWSLACKVTWQPTTIIYSCISTRPRIGATSLGPIFQVTKGVVGPGGVSERILQSATALPKVMRRTPAKFARERHSPNKTILMDNLELLFLFFLFQNNKKIASEFESNYSMDTSEDKRRFSFEIYQTSRAHCPQN